MGIGVILDVKCGYISPKVWLTTVMGWAGVVVIVMVVVMVNLQSLLLFVPTDRQSRDRCHGRHEPLFLTWPAVPPSFRYPMANQIVPSMSGDDGAHTTAYHHGSPQTTTYDHRRPQTTIYDHIRPYTTTYDHIRLHTTTSQQYHRLVDEPRNG